MLTLLTCLLAFAEAGVTSSASTDTTSLNQTLAKRNNHKEFWEYQGYYTNVGPYRIVEDLPEGMHNDRYSVPIEVSHHKCFNTILNSTDLSKASRNMGAWCEHFEVAPDSIYASVVNDAVVYVCSERKQKPCNIIEWREVEAYLDKHCGPNMAGKVFLKKFKKYYGRSEPYKMICPKINAHESWDYEVKPEAVWVDGKMYEEWKYGY